MRKSSRFNKFLKIFLGLSIVLTLFLQVIKPTSLYQSVDRSLYTFSSYLKYVLFQSPIKTIQDSMSGFVSLKDAYDENRILRNQVDSVSQLETRLIEANKENVELKNLLGLQQTMSDTLIFNANVISKDSSNFNNTLLINKGSNDGLAISMAVITPEGLIGRLSNVEENTSIVTLLTSQEGRNQFALKIQLDEENTVEALMESYDTDSQQYIVRLLDSTKSVEPGMKVVTSGLGEIVPSGLLVGEIETVENSPATLSVIMRVKPAVSYSNINVVMVVSKP